MTNIDDDALLQRKPLAAALTERGFPVSYRTLTTMASKGKGPPFRRFGKAALYRWGDALNWVERRLSPPKGGDVELGRAAA